MDKYGFSFIGDIDNSILASDSLVEDLEKKMSGGRMIRKYWTLIIVCESEKYVDYVVKKLKDMYGEKVSMIVMKDILKPLEQAFRGSLIFIGGIASVTLIVASIGVMNAMFTAVIERKYVIGLMRALGCMKKDILLMFLFEALILSVIALTIGIPIGYGVAYILLILISIVTSGGKVETLPTPTLSIDSLIIILTITLGVTLFGALPPALKASKIEPARALRPE